MSPDQPASVGQRKRRMSLVMTVLLLALYGGFLALVRYARGWMATPVGPVTIGLMVAAGVVVGFCLLSLVYVVAANRLQAERSGS